EPSNRQILSCSKRSAPRPTILKKIPSACDILNSARSTCSSAPVSSKPAARPSLVPAANSPACSGQYAARTPSSLSAAATSTDALKTTGQNVRWLEFHSHVAHPLPGLPRRIFPVDGNRSLTVAARIEVTATPIGAATVRERLPV